MNDLDRFIWDCTDEKVVRIVGKLAERGMAMKDASELVQRWRAKGWEKVTMEERSSILRAISRL